MPVISIRVRAALAAGLSLCLVGPATAGAASLSLPPSYQDSITMQAQQKDQWCWAGSGNTIAEYHGVDLTQTRFCQLAHGESGQDCANLPGTLADPRRAFAELGFASPGTYLNSRVSYATIQAQTAADHPIETRIGWRSGGGHMHVVYGYDTSNQWVYWGDPWPANHRYNWSTYGYYAQNSSFTWTHTLTGISR